VVASRVKDITRAGGGSDAVANSELLVARRFFSRYPLQFPFYARFGPVWPVLLALFPCQRDKRHYGSFCMSKGHYGIAFLVLENNVNRLSLGHH
jgi:hypothetical protein